MTQYQPIIQLYSSPTSPYVQKIGCYLKYKQLDYKLIQIDNDNHYSNNQFHDSTPVLQVGECRSNDMDEAGLWLDELYPQKPIMPAEKTARAQVLSIDHWVNSVLVPSFLRRATKWNLSLDDTQANNKWSMSLTMSRGALLPWYARLMLFLNITKTSYFVHLIQQVLNFSQSMTTTPKHMHREFVEHLGKGPFLGGQPTPTLADLSAYPVIVLGYLMGMSVKDSMLDSSIIAGWARRVQAHLPENPLLVPEQFLIRAQI